MIEWEHKNKLIVYVNPFSAIMVACCSIYRSFLQIKIVQKRPSPVKMGITATSNNSFVSIVVC